MSWLIQREIVNMVTNICNDWDIEEIVRLRVERLFFP
jgi:hypothetical protein